MKNILFTLFLILFTGLIFLFLGNFFFHQFGWIEEEFPFKTGKKIIDACLVSGVLMFLVRLLPGRTWV